MKPKLTFDIETIPQQSKLSEVQQKELDKKVQRFMEYDSRNLDEEEARNLIMSTNPYFGQIVCIGLYKVTKRREGTKSLTGSEYEILGNFWDTIEKFDGIFISYNGLDFDVPFIVKRSMRHGLQPTNEDFTDTYPWATDPHFDVQKVLSDYSKSAVVSLEMACDFLGISSPKEGDVNAQNLEQAYHEGKIKQIADYCIRDVKKTYEVYEIVRNYTRN